MLHSKLKECLSTFNLFKLIGSFNEPEAQCCRIYTFVITVAITHDQIFIYSQCANIILNPLVIYPSNKFSVGDLLFRSAWVYITSCPLVLRILGNRLKECQCRPVMKTF